MNLSKLHYVVAAERFPLVPSDKGSDGCDPHTHPHLLSSSLISALKRGVGARWLNASLIQVPAMSASKIQDRIPHVKLTMANQRSAIAR